MGLPSNVAALRVQLLTALIAGEVSDAAHCVKGVVTVLGPAFYECKPVL